MTFEVYVWPPGYGLPSADAECVSALAYLNLVLAADQWNIIESSDASASPTGMNKSTGGWVSGKQIGSR